MSAQHCPRHLRASRPHHFRAGIRFCRWQLRVLLVGQIVNAAAGSVGWLILLSGRQNVAARVYGWVALIHLVLLAVLTPVFGTVGAAAATTLTMSLWNVWLHAAVVREDNVRPSIIFNLRSARARRGNPAPEGAARLMPGAALLERIRPRPGRHGLVGMHAGKWHCRLSPCDLRCGRSRQGVVGHRAKRPRLAGE